MAIMINCAQDWTYDFFIEDSKLYKATPIKGVHCRKDASDREQFMVWLKNAARDFTAEWKQDHKGFYDRYDGWIGDAFAQTLCRGIFSDVYKDTYGQRPHLPIWFYVHLLGMPMQEDTARTFCASPVEDAMEEAEFRRTHF